MSKSELHDWECAIEKLGGDNADQLLDIAQDIYNTGYVRGKNSMSYVFEDIKAEIDSYAKHEVIAISYGEELGLRLALEIIEKHISGKENHGTKTRG